MFYSQTPPAEWAKKYGIELHGMECSRCGHELKLTKPLVFKGYRGLEAAPCESCKEESGRFRVVPVGEDKVSLWNKLTHLFVSSG